MKDLHCHFTGSLPINYIWNCFLTNSPNLGNNIISTSLVENKVENLEDFKYFILNLYSECYKDNIVHFFSLYEWVQLITKDEKDLYEKGSYLITRENIYEGINQFEIIAGGKNQIDLTKSRFLKMIKGIEICETEFRKKNIAKIRITFIRDSNKVFKNLTNQILSEILLLLDKSDEIATRISGFDFSGEENPKDLALMCETIQEISNFNKYRMNRKKNTFSISIHFGENMRDFSIEEYIIAIQKLITLQFDRIIHGTAFWIPQNIVNISNFVEIERLRILKYLAQKKIIFDICPTANQILTPFCNSKRGIELQMLKAAGLQITINTDNKTLFSTNIRNEMAKINYL